MGENAEAINEHLKLYPDVPGVVTGDEVRLRQVITNLCRLDSPSYVFFLPGFLIVSSIYSNATKFTPSGGRISVSTRLILPPSVAASDTVVGDPEKGKISPVSGTDSPYGGNDPPPLSTSMLIQHNQTELKRIVVRIEIADTGPGIRRGDVNKLFSE